MLSLSPQGSGFQFRVHWQLDPINNPTDDDSKHLHEALQIRELSHPLSFNPHHDLVRWEEQALFLPLFYRRN